ncbi:MAG TPA: glycoside hydrolase TIM-barrel-like domain-containing protein, partial [Lacipirellulaceae bacterium]|nr:glycoside hydrolase TIM-barrel-like domain-containing protein [Lacipirellulaceae bacterium]
AFDPGFRDGTLSPVRFIEQRAAGDPPDTSGLFPVPASGAPSLSHIAAGVVRAKQLGMTVTVSPLVELELVGGALRAHRSQYGLNPTGAQAGRFWPAYQQYLVETAQMARAAGADRMTVGSQLKGLTTNPGHAPHWAAAIDAVRANFPRQIGYAAAWDEYNHASTTAAIWEHAAIDFLGVDAFYPMATATQADASGTRPNPAFVELVRDGWNNLLDDVHSLSPAQSGMVAFAAARQGGAGLPLVFTETGYLPYNRTSLQGSAVQSNPPVVDQDEQVMSFDGLLQALDGRRAAGEVLAISVRQWSMPGSELTPLALWNLAAAGGGGAALNAPAFEFLSHFVNNPMLASADFDSDGAVAAGDLVRWRAGYGTASGATRATGDATGDGAVDGADFLAWQRQLGTGLAGAAHAAPEPATHLLAAVAWFGCRRRAGGRRGPSVG